MSYSGFSGHLYPSLHRIASHLPPSKYGGGGLDFDCRSGGKKNAISDPKMANFVQTDVRMWIFRPPLSLNNFLPFQHRQNRGGGGCLLVQEHKEPLVTQHW